MRLFRASLILLASVAMAGCDVNSSQDNPGRQAASEWQVDPQQVSAEALRAAVTDPEVKRFYEARNWAAVWDQERTGALTAALSHSVQHGLDHIAFLPASAPEAPAAREAALTKAALDYSNALAHGVIDPRRIWKDYTLAPWKVDVAAGLAKVLEQGKLPAWFNSLAPQTEEYRALSAAYVDYRRRAASQNEAPIQGGDQIHVGDRDPRVPAIVEGLRANGYLPDGDAGQADAKTSGAKQGDAEGQVYTKAISQAVARLQANYGIEDDGIVGPETLEVLNSGPGDRARQLAVNLERRRWLDRRPAPTRIDVNTAATFLDYWRDGTHREHRVVVVGQPEWETPQLGSPMYRLVANPSWTVPKSIEEEEIASKGAAYMRANNMVRKGGFIVQEPGPKNSLGQVKFDMRNDKAIYLHDTPAKALFAENERHRSHGCVRVQDAIGFARLLASDDGISADFDKAMATGDEKFVSLKKQIPVRLLYHTAFFDSGAVHLRTDAYGWDEDVAGALRLPQRTRRTLKTRIDDVGP